MTIASAPKLENLHPPLARDTAGNLVAVPDGTCAWRIFRETSGRPREIRGPDKNPVRFPLHTSSDDLVELCGPGVFRVYALDQLGEMIADEPIAKWDLATPAREQRNASMDPMLALRADRSTTVASTIAAPMTDLRFALETMAQMMRTNTDALRLVAESQVDLAKTIATVKGLPRNAAQSQAAPVIAANANANADSDDDEEDDDSAEETEESAAAAPTNIYDVLMPFSEKAAELFPVFLGGAAPGLTALAPVAAPAPASSEPDLAIRPPAASPTHGATVSFRERVMKDPQLLRQVLAIKAALAPDEIALLMSAAANWPEADQSVFLETIKRHPDKAVEFCREVIATVRAQRAASQS